MGTKIHVQFLDNKHCFKQKFIIICIFIISYVLSHIFSRFFSFSSLHVICILPVEDTVVQAVDSLFFNHFSQRLLLNFLPHFPFSLYIYAHNSVGATFQENLKIMPFLMEVKHMVFKKKNN